MIQTHLAHDPSMPEFLPLIKQTPIEIDDESDDNLINMHQLLEIGPGSFILLNASFKRNLSDSKFIRMPILEDFRLNSQLTHTGFPYPSQHTSWSLCDKWVEACPLRTDQVPLFQQIERKRKNLSQQLLFNPIFIQKSRRCSKIKRDVFDQHRSLFLPLHRQMQEILMQEIAPLENLSVQILDTFYEEVLVAPSAFDILVQTQQQIVDLFIKNPLKSLEEEWLGTELTPLRLGTPHEKLQTAYQKLNDHQKKAYKKLDQTQPRQAYILQQGSLLGQAFQAVALQYQSEKMGFAPPLLSEIERKLQACAFQQQIAFIEECHRHLDSYSPCQVKEALLAAWSKDLNFLQSSNIEELHPASVSIIDEIEIYFNTRFYTTHSRRH